MEPPTESKARPKQILIRGRAVVCRTTPVNGHAEYCSNPCVGRNGYTGDILLVQHSPENAEGDKRGAIRARRTRLQSGLLAKIPEGVIQFNKKLISLEDVGTNAGVRLSFEDQTEVVADLVIGADGIRSVGFASPAESHIGS